MKKTLRGKLTYANVISTLCLFLLLGGGAAFAASQLARNSVGTKQLKKKAVTTSKIKNGAVTGAKINLATLGAVPNAIHANTADTAGTADKAGTAGTANIAAALAPPEAVHYVGAPGEPTLGPGFVAGPKQLGFYKDRQCVVHLLGQASGPSGDDVFILPEADWPANVAFEGIAVSGPMLGNVEIVGDGEVRIYFEGTGSKNVGLDGVTLRAAAC